MHFSANILSSFACLQPTLWVLVSELRQIHNLAPALFKSRTLKNKLKDVRRKRLTANLQTLAPSLHSLETYSSSLRSKISLLVLFVTNLTWNNCLLQQGPLGDRRIPCCPRTGWHLWGNFQAEGSPGHSGAPEKDPYRQTWPFHNSRLLPGPPFLSNTHCPKRSRAPQSSSPACPPFSGQPRLILLVLRSKKSSSASGESHCRSWADFLSRGLCLSVAVTHT